MSFRLSYGDIRRQRFYQRFCRYIRIFLFAFLLFPCQGTQVLEAGSQVLADESRKREDWLARMEAERIPKLGLPISSSPDGLVLFYLNDSDKWLPSGPRLAVMDYESSRQVTRLVIYRGFNGDLIEDYALELDPEVGWETIESLPARGVSRRGLAGVVVWGGTGGTGHSYALVVGAFDGNFEIVFRGHNVELLDVDFDGIPEILDSRHPPEDCGPPAEMRVWTWDGRKYNEVARVARSRIFPEHLRRTLNERKKGPLEGSAPPGDGGLSACRD